MTKSAHYKGYAYATVVASESSGNSNSESINDTDDIINNIETNDEWILLA